MSALSYYTAKNRASSRLDTKKNEISRSSAYMIDTGGSYNKTSSYTPSLKRESSFSTDKTSSYTPSLKRESSFSTDSGRAGRTRYRDHSVDYSSRPSRRSSSLEISAPIKPRARDISIDLTSSRRDYTNGISSTNSYVSSSRASRPKTTNFDDEHSDEYKRIMSNTDKYLTMSKYSKQDKETEEANGMVEEERRSKAYSKIINQQSAASLETDSTRETLNNIFMNTSGFSAKSVQAITKEMLYKEERPKNYGWRKDMENFEDNLEKTAQHKKNVRIATQATRDVGFKDTNSKIRDYDRESRRNVDADTPQTNGIIINTKPITQTPSYSSTIERKNTENNSYRSSQTISSISDSMTDTTEVKRGSWRKDMEKYEDQITKKKQSDTKIDLTQKVTSSAVNSEPKTYSWQKSNNSSTDKKISETAKDASSSWKKPETVKEVEVKSSEPAWRKTETVKIEEPKKTEPAWKKSVTVNKVEPPKVSEPEKSVPKWKKPETEKVEDVKPVQQPATEQRIPTAPLTTDEKTTSSWKKPESAKKEEAKTPETKATETEKPVPKWKKQTAVKKEEPAPAEPEKSVPKWKKPEPAQKEEAKPVETKATEPEKPAPKWKKPEAVKKEEPKPVEPKPTEAEKSVPKWKKQPAVKKEEPKPAEPEKPVPKWKKPATPKKEEPKPAEPEKPVPKWKKPQAAKVEEVKPAEPEKPVPKWKKPAAPKKEEPKEEPESIPTVSVPEVVKEPEPEPEIQTKTECDTTETANSAVSNSEEPTKAEEEKTEEEKEEEDVTGMRAMRKEQASKFSDMDAEFAAGASKLSALRAKMKALRMKHKAAAEADAAA